MQNNKFFKKILKLNYFHYNKSVEFRRIVNLIFNKKKFFNIEDLPFLPTRLFKEINLKSISNKRIFKILNSSGTSGNKPSKIFLDKENALRQTKVLNEIVSNVIGNKRIPMLIVDEKDNIDDKKEFDAKTAAVIGFSLFGTNHTFLLKKKKINYNALNDFLRKFSKQKFLIFGFTSYIFDYLINKISKNKIKYDLSKAIIIHGGGWKKMFLQSISKDEFKKKLLRKLKIKEIYNYYGLVEQTGSIFFECKSCGCFNPSEYSDIIIRDKNLNILKKNRVGFVQLLSLLPKSYPGHSILTEDLGEIVENNCPLCKNKKKFLIYGRAKQSEIRGCSDI